MSGTFVCNRFKAHFQNIGTIDAINWHFTMQFCGSICANSQFGGELVKFRLTRTDEDKCIRYWHGYVVYQRDLTPEEWKAGRGGGFPNWPRKPK